MNGTLYGIGTGPGAPDLLTLRAARMIEQARVIAYPVLPGRESFVRAIVAELIAPGTQEIAMQIPMSPDRAPAQAAYDDAAIQIAARLQAGEDVHVLCEGDPLFYGSFMYLLARLEGRFTVQVVPGVTSISACAAETRRPLVARTENLAVLAGTLPADELRARLQNADSAAILKVGRHMAKIRGVIAALDLLDQAKFVAHASLPQQQMMPLAEAPDDAPYFSMILITKGADPWL